MTFWPFLAMVGGSLLLLCVLFVVSARLFSRHASDAFKNALEVVKIVGFLLVAAFTFVFIDRQRQELSQAEYDFKVYQAFLEASNAPQTETRLRVLANITTYRQTFLKPGARLDNALVALSKTLVDDQSIKLALSAPANSTIASALAADRSTVLSAQVKSLEEILGPLDTMTAQEREKWAASNHVFVPLPFPLTLGFDPRKQVQRIRVHRLAVPFFEAVFRDIQAAGLQGALHTFDGASNLALKPQGGRLSGHVYGVAIDFNGETNRLGPGGDMDERVIAIFRRNGFLWGGDWTGDTRNPAHFELSGDALTGKLQPSQL